ncbi:MAG: hypothetical protein U0175_04775 [Caldilineaceae bacterium]
MSLLQASKLRYHPSSGRTPCRLRPWQIALSSFYAVLFAFVLPFVCFGKLAEPDHPHRFPHLVFVEPPVVEPQGWISAIVQKAAFSNAASSLYDRFLAPAILQTTGRAPQTVNSASTLPAGRATSTLVIFEVLTLILLYAWAISRIDHPHSVILIPHPFPASITPTILLPPPRQNIAFR